MRAPSPARWWSSGRPTRPGATATATTASTRRSTRIPRRLRPLPDAEGRYAFLTARPYPYRNRVNDWRPAHIHFSLFGSGFAQRLITQMYFEGDPLIRHDSILATIPDPAARERLVASLDLEASVPLDTLAYRWDIVLRGRRSMLFENRLQGTDAMRTDTWLAETPSQTAGPMSISA